MKDTIVNKNGQLHVVTGRGVAAFKYKALILALRFKQKTGMDLDRRVPAVKIAKRDTGLKTNNIDTLIAAVAALMDREIAACEIVTERDPDVCPQCGKRNTNELAGTEHECYDCGQTYDTAK